MLFLLPFFNIKFIIKTRDRLMQENNNLNPYIYIIEDEEAISKLISLYLSKSGMTSAIFSNAEDALDSLKADKRPDLIILDLNLPKMNGFDFLEKLKKEQNSSIPVMIVSARDADEDIIQGLGFGADEFVTKPFSPKEPSSVVINNSEQASSIFSCQKISSFVLAPIII